MIIFMFYNVQITFKSVSENVCSEKMNWYVEWRKMEIRHFFVIVLVVKTFHFPMDYMLLYGNKPTSKYVGIHFNLVGNYCLTILHLSVET